MIGSFHPARVTCGIAARGPDLIAVVVQSGSDGFQLLGRTVLRAFRERPPADWGAEYMAFLRRLGLRQVSASFCLPREDVVFRTVRLPAMRARDVAKAVSLQLDDLHPFGDAPVYSDFALLDGKRSGRQQRLAAVAIARAEQVDALAGMLAAAGVRLAACTVSAGALRSAVRSGGGEPARPVAVGVIAGTTLEVYGESESCPALSSAVDLGGMTLAGALRLTYDGLRLGDHQHAGLVLVGGEGEEPDLPGFAAVPAESAFGFARDERAGANLASDVVPAGAAMECARPRLGLGLNLLPKRTRGPGSSRRARLRACLLVALALVAAAFAVRPVVQDRLYAARLREETARLGGQRDSSGPDAAALAALQEPRDWLLSRQARVRSDLDLLREISALAQGTARLDSVTLAEEHVYLTGSAADAAAVLRAVASSSSLANARLAGAPAISERGETFRIEADRR